MKRLLLLTAALLLSGAALAQEGYERQRRDLFDVLPVRSNDIIFLGDGLTDGCEWAELFDNRHIKNRGIRGDRSEWLLERLDTLIAGHPKKLFLMIGTNDLAAGVAPARIVEHVRRLIDRFRTESRWTKLYVQSILPVNGRSFDRYAEHYARDNDSHVVASFLHPFVYLYIIVKTPHFVKGCVALQRQMC